jgi:hypothetical protein
MLFPPSACKVLDTWHTTGLSGTGSHDYLVEDVFVPFEESWNLPSDPSAPALSTVSRRCF